MNIDLTEPWSGTPLCLSVLAESPNLLRCELCRKNFKSSSTYASHLETTKVWLFCLPDQRFKRLFLFHSTNAWSWRCKISLRPRKPMWEV
jgi:uncharacterized C2H2 Zn-finger protein